MKEELRCKGHTVSQRYPYPRTPCKYTAWKDGYCKIHHPEEKRKRNSDRLKAKEKLYQESLPNRTGGR